MADVKVEKYSGTDLTFNTSTNYDSAKVMVWSDLETLEPLAEVEIVNLK